MSSCKTPLLVTIVGPTASGKSTLGVWLAERFEGEILACDSTQLYRGFDIGTAKPTIAERRGVPHHLLDVLSPLEEATAGGYRHLALEVLADLRGRGRLPILTVGTGLYLRALLDGLAELPLRSGELRERLRLSAAKHKPGHLHRMLLRLDRDTAAKIAPNDEQKVIRAIEVCLLARKPLSEVHRSGRTPLEGWRPLKIGLRPARDELHERIARRTAAMLSSGWMQEVEALQASGLPEHAKPFEFLGYRELLAVQRRGKSLDQASAAIAQATRQYAKRQITWFRRERDVHWLDGFGDAATVRQEACAWLVEQGLTPSRGGAGERV